MLLFFTNLSPVELRVRCLALFYLCSIIDSFKWFWVGNCHKNILLILEILKATFLALHFSYYTSMTFLIILSVILLSTQVWSGIWFVATSRVSWCIGAGGGLLVPLLEKLNLFCLTGLITLVVLIWKWMGLFLRENHLWGCWIVFLFKIGLELLLYLYCWNYLEENWTLYSAHEVSFSWGCSVSLQVYHMMA